MRGHRLTRRILNGDLIKCTGHPVKPPVEAYRGFLLLPLPRLSISQMAVDGIEEEEYLIYYGMPKYIRLTMWGYLEHTPTLYINKGAKEAL